MELSKRLQAVIDFVSKGYQVAEIGCDHAYSCISLVRSEISPFCIAMDIRKGPLEIAERNIKKYHCTKQIETRLSDGAKKLKKGEFDTILISGMGGRLIYQILFESEEIIKTAKEFILQPQSEAELIRKYLHKIEFQIIKESMILEEGKYYIIIKAVPGRESYKREVFYRFGKLLLESKNLCLFEFLQYRLKRHQEILNQLEKSKKDIEERKEKIKEDLNYIKEGLEFYEM